MIIFTKPEGEDSIQLVSDCLKVIYFSQRGCQNKKFGTQTKAESSITWVALTSYQEGKFLHL